MRAVKNQILDWKKMTAPLRAAPAKALKIIRTFANRELEIFRNRIENAEFPAFDATPLSEDWLAYKAAHNLDLRTMIATGHYIKSIKVIVEKTKRGYNVFIGFDKKDMAIDPETKLPTPFPLYRLAEVQEFGSEKAHVPARPHWAPALQELAKRAGGVRVKMQQSVLGKK